jgi:hypothetical protein
MDDPISKHVFTKKDSALGVKKIHFSVALRFYIKTLNLFDQV